MVSGVQLVGEVTFILYLIFCLLAAGNRSTMTVVQQQPQPNASNPPHGAVPGTSSPAQSAQAAVHTTATSTNPSCSTVSGQGAVGTVGPSVVPVNCQQPPVPSKITPKPGTAVLSHPLSPNHSSGSDTDPIVLTTAAAAATALRRLYFKSGRNARPKGPTVPMVRQTKCPLKLFYYISSFPISQVVVMGTSTASNSEATINTSTDSASTLVTNVTSNTDTDATNDSLDLGEHSGQSEPLLSSLDEPSNSLSSLMSPRLLKSHASDQESLIESPCTVYYQKRPLKHNHQASSSISEDDDLIEISGLNDIYPRTAPPTVANNQQSRFPFDDRQSAKASSTKFTFEDTQTTSLRRSSGKFVESSSSSSSSPSSVSANTVTIISPSSGRAEEDGKSSRKEVTHQRFASPNGNNSGLNRVVFRDKCSAKKRINSAPLASSGNSKLDSTMFPFDREAIDYERIQRECFAVEESDEPARPYPFLDLDTDPESPVYEKPGSIFQSPSKSPYRRSVHEANEMTERCRSGNTPDDIFRQYTLFSQQEKTRSQGQQDRERDRRSPNMKRAKGASSRQADAFSPKPPKSRHSPGNCEQEESFICSGATVSPSSTGGAPTVLKFDQINSKFEQIPPNQTRTSNCYSSNGNLSRKSSSVNVNALSPTLSAHHGHHRSHHSHHHFAPDPNLSPTVRVTPPLPDLRVDYFNSQHRSDDDDEDGNVDNDLNEAEGKRRHSQSRSRRKSKSPDHGYNKSHSHSQYNAMTLLSSNEGGGGSDVDDNDQRHSRGSGSGSGGEAAALDECQKNAQQLRSINVTPNPMDGPVCTQPPRATIVVQQVNKKKYSIIFLCFVEVSHLFAKVVEKEHKSSSSCALFSGFQFPMVVDLVLVSSL